MSYLTLSAQVLDEALRDRVNACINQEARENPNVADTPTAEAIRSGGIGIVGKFMWAVALNTEAEYASALAAENPDPGADESVISDGMILSAVQTSWPDSPTPAAASAPTKTRRKRSGAE